MTDDVQGAAMTYQGQQGPGVPTTDAAEGRRRLSGGAIASLSGIGVLIIFRVPNTEDVTGDVLCWSFTWPRWWLIPVLSGACAYWSSRGSARSCGSEPASYAVTGAAPGAAKLDGAEGLEHATDASVRRAPRSRHRRDRSCLDVVDPARHLDAVGQQGRRLDRGDVVADTLLEVGEGKEVDAGRVDTALGRQLVAQVVIGEREHAAVGVVHHGELVRAEQLGGDDEGTDGVVRCAAAGVADHVRVADVEAERLLGVDARIHARQHREVLGRGHRLVPVAKLAHELLVPIDEPLEHTHGSNLRDRGRTGPKTLPIRSGFRPAAISPPST